MRHFSLFIAAAAALTSQAQLLTAAGTATTPTVSTTGIEVPPNMEGALLIEGVTPPSPGRQATAKRVASLTPSGDIYGVRIYSNVWTDYAHQGIYSLNPGNPKSTALVTGDLFATSRGIVHADGKLWISHVVKGWSMGADYSVTGTNSVTHYIYNLATGEIERTINPGFPSGTGRSMFYDRYTGRIYGSFSNNAFNGNVYGTLDLEAGRTTIIANLEPDITAVVIDKNRRMWGIAYNTGVLYEIDINTGTLRKVGNTGVKSSYVNCGVIDPITDTYYYHVCTNGYSALYAIDTATADAELVYVFPNSDEWVTMWMYPRTGIHVPAAPQSLAANFDGLQGTVTFTVPTEMCDGSMGIGTAAYDVYVEGYNVAHGTAAYGTKVTVPLTVEHGGETVIAVALTDGDGEGPVKLLNATIGDAAVPVPATATLTQGGSKFSLRWNSVALEGVTYSVTRYPDEVTVATALTDTTFTEAIPATAARTEYFYAVTAHLGNAQSSIKTSNHLFYGPAALPYSNHFESEDRFNELTYINANNDAYKWTYAVNVTLVGGIHGIYVPKNARELTWLEKIQGVKPETDDWAITPGLPLEAGKTYTVSYSLFGTYANSSDYRERYEVKIGTSPTVAGMTTSIVGQTILSVDVPTTFTYSFQVATSGTYYIGLHGCSAGGFWFACTGIDVSEGVATTAPNAPKYMTVTPDAGGDLTADVAIVRSNWNTLRQTINDPIRIDLELNDKVVYSWDNVAKNDTVRATIAVPIDDDYEFVAVPYTLDGERGLPAKQSAYVGVRVPQSVSEATLTRTNDTGEVNVTWTPVTADSKGNAVNADKLCYMVYDADENVIGDSLKTTSITFQALDYDRDPQRFVHYYVTAIYGRFQNMFPAYTGYLPVGKPYELPFVESDSDGFKYSWTDEGSLTLLTMENYDLLESVDGDGTFVGFYGTEADATGSLISAYIHVTGDEPKLRFSYAAYTGCSNTLEAKVMCDGKLTSLGTVTMSTGAEGDGYTWMPAEFDLSQFVGKNIQLVFTGTIVSHTVMFFDGISVTSTATGLPGDINGDGQVDIDDVNELINAVLADELIAAGDFTDDGTLDIDDINALINLILAN